jgi:hypothetical protein
MKKVGNCLYVHRSAVDSLSESYQQAVREAEALLPSNLADYQVVKLDIKALAVSFILSPDWNVANEPLVGDSCKIFLDNGKVTITKEKGQIYHHKWMFVKSDYTGFDIEQSKARSELWQSRIPQTKEVKSRIGYKEFWIRILREYALDL